MTEVHVGQHVDDVIDCQAAAGPIPAPLPGDELLAAGRAVG